MEATAFVSLQMDVELMVRATGRIDEAEQLIERLDLNEDEKAALWLWGWSLLPQKRQRQTALSYLQQVEGDRWSF
jgi:predicted amidohydrolase YtcJ